MSICAWSALIAACSCSDQRLLLVIALPGLEPGAEELGIAVEIELGAGELGLVLLLGRLRLFERRLVGPRIDLEQRIAFLDLLAFLEIDLDDLAVDPGLDGDHVVGLNRADALQEHRDILGKDGPGRHRDAGAGVCAVALGPLPPRKCHPITAAAATTMIAAAPIARLTMPSDSLG